MKLSFLRTQHVLIWSFGVLLALFYCLLSGHIDFHPDEAIYFKMIPISPIINSGIFYNLSYGLVQYVLEGPQSARFVSAAFGGATFVAVSYIFMASRPLRPHHVFFLFTLFACSYQALFVFIRVRPEASWWFCAVLAVCAMWRLENKHEDNRPYTKYLLLAPFILLPMNHRLSWFAALFLGGYAILFVVRKVGWRVAISVLFAILAGGLLNAILQSLLSESNAIPGSTLSSTKLTPTRFMRWLFYLDTADVAANPNLYQWLNLKDQRIFSHAIIQNALWFAVAFVIPCMGKTWKERYIYSFPLFALFAFGAVGRYNQTYSGGFSLACVVILAYNAYVNIGWRRYVAGVIAGVSVLNGASFIATRILNHGKATFFSAEQDIRQRIQEKHSKNPNLKVSIPERFFPATTTLPLKNISNNSKFIPQDDIDFLVIDSSDDLVSAGYLKRKKIEQKQQALRMCLARQVRLPVYWNDSFFDNNLLLASRQRGSPFFRNSTAYSLSIFERCPVDNAKLPTQTCQTPAECERKNHEIDNFPVLVKGQRIFFKKLGDGYAYMQTFNGFSPAEKWGTWTDGKLGEIAFYFEASNGSLPSTASLEIVPFITKNIPKQNFTISINDVVTKKVTLTESKRQLINIQIPEHALNNTNIIRIRFILANATRPSEMGISSDNRELALGLIALTLQ
jgi:hypothetical protein